MILLGLDEYPVRFDTIELDKEFYGLRSGNDRYGFQVQGYS